MTLIFCLTCIIPQNLYFMKIMTIKGVNTVIKLPRCIFFFFTKKTKNGLGLCFKICRLLNREAWALNSFSFRGHTVPKIRVTFRPRKLISIYEASHAFYKDKEFSFIKCYSKANMYRIDTEYPKRSNKRGFGSRFDNNCISITRWRQSHVKSNSRFRSGGCLSYRFTCFCLIHSWKVSYTKITAPLHLSAKSTF